MSILLWTHQEDLLIVLARPTPKAYGGNGNCMTAHGTELFEQLPIRYESGVALKRLEEELARSGVQLTHTPDRPAPGIQPLTPQEFAATFRVFQQHMKCNGLSNAQVRSALAAQPENAHTDRLARFIDLYERISAVWDRKLKEGGILISKTCSFLQLSALKKAAIKILIR